MATIFTIPGSTILAGPIAAGPFFVPSSSPGIDLELDISTVTNNCNLTLAFLVSYDGGATWRAGGSTTTPIVNGRVNSDDGPTGILPLRVGFDSLQPTNNRQVKVTGSVDATLIILPSPLTV